MLPKTKEALDILCQDEFFNENDIRFVGGTALSYLIKHRLSEDLDFATLAFERNKIQKLMEKYGAQEMEHGSYLKDTTQNQGEDISDSYVKYNFNGVKVEFFTPPFNVLEEKVWKNDKFSYYEESSLRLSSFETISYMKTMAFWNRKKYRDIYDIYFMLSKNLLTTSDFLERYKEHHITYTTDMLLEKIRSKKEFFEKQDDEGINTLVEDPKPYEWYRSQIEEFIYTEYLKEIYKT